MCSWAEVDIDKMGIIGLISEDDSNSIWLQSIMYNRALISSTSLTQIMERNQVLLKSHVSYVPEYVIRDSNMTPEMVLHGLALSYENGNEWKRFGLELCSFFSIDCKKDLSLLSEEQNRIFVIISALLQPCKLYLLERPGKQIRREYYIDLLKEFAKKIPIGADIIIAENTVSDIVLPCASYLFLKEGEIVAQYSRAQLPKPAKILTIKGGDWTWLESNHVTIIQNKGNKATFLCKDMETRELALRICKTGCDDFRVEDISVEDLVFGNYQRWSL